MARLNSYVASCALLLLCHLSASRALPVRDLSAEKHAHCASLFGSLLDNVKQLLQNDVLCFGISADKVAPRDAAAIRPCAPTNTQSSSCAWQSNSSFSESECLRNVMKDLSDFDAVIQSYLKLQLRRSDREVPHLRPTLGIIQSVRKSCALTPGGEEDSTLAPEGHAAETWDGDFFSNRYAMCKMVRGFHIRLITINRAVRYISSGDHTK